MGKRVIVVDDVELERQVLCDLLKDVGYEPVAFSTGAEVLQQALDQFAAILADVNMPRMDGRSLLGTVRDAKGSAIPFVYVTGTEDPRTLVPDGIKYGAEFLAKPVTLESLLEALFPLIGPP